MKPLKPLLLTTGASAILLSGCSQINTAHILSKDEAQVAISLNKDFALSVVSVNDGERIEPCVKRDPMQQKETDSTDTNWCVPKEGKILYKQTYEVIVREGSTCISIWAGDREFEFCDPPYKLTF